MLNGMDHPAEGSNNNKRPHIDQRGLKVIERFRGRGKLTSCKDLPALQPVCVRLAAQAGTGRRKAAKNRKN
jgi:hypothetical protein